MSKPRDDRLTAQGWLTAYYNEPEIARYSRLEVQVIRQLAEDEVIGSVEVTNEERRYSAEQLALLRRVRRLYHDLGINLEGIEIIVRLIAHIERLQRELARYQGMAAPPPPE